MKYYNLLNNIFGWAAFGIAAFTYLRTVEPTASFWDCPEFIACAAKGEVGHPPGNAFFNLTGRFFVNFAGGDMSRAAVWVNRMSALFSAGTILFLFWTITALTRKLILSNGETCKNPSCTQTIAILGSGMVGALAYTWSDTFWFSAVEAEVYAFSSFMTALVFWLILKWEARAEDESSDKYILLIAYLIGLSIGVHLLNLLTIPAIVLVFYFKKDTQPNLRKTLGILLLSFVLVALILYGIVPGVVSLAGYVELFFVNTLGLCYNSGTLFCFLSLLGIIVFSLWKVYHGKWFAKHARLASNILLCLLFILIGYSTFAQVIIRASAKLPMNENNPDEIFGLGRYLGREQYGDNPLLFGQTFASDVARNRDGSAKVKIGAPIYGKVVKRNTSEPDHYIVTGHREKYEYNYTMFFPRMYSKQSHHIDGYKQWSDYKGEKVRVGGKTITVPTFTENLKYFFRYQVNFMYWRYFMWNFSGRQSDVKCYGEIDRGNWITGIPCIDRLLIGSSCDELPSAIRENKGHNVFYMLPLLLGLIGLFWQAYSGERGIQGFWIVFFLFFMTGLAIVIYLNQTPFPPRERDYAYAGSFYAFSIWIGMGVAGIIHIINNIIGKNNFILAGIIAVICLGVPLQMVSQTWDDHDRTGRYAARDFGKNYLDSLDENAIIICDGDNDTFPLWYAQDVENHRTDVRACNYEYLQTDWYINQMKSPMYDSAPLPIPFVPEQTEDFYLMQDLPEIQRLCKQLNIDLSDKLYLVKNEIALLAMIGEIAKDGWKRPIYVASTASAAVNLNLNRHFRLCGLAYQIVPEDNDGEIRCDIDKMYDRMMNKFRWGVEREIGKTEDGREIPDVYLDETVRNLYQTHRMMFCRLIDDLLEIGDYERALKATELCLEKIPSTFVMHDYYSLTLAQTFFLCDKTAEGRQLILEILDQNKDYLEWAFKIDETFRQTISSKIREHILTMRETLQVAETYKQKDIVNDNYDALKLYIDNAYNKYKIFGKN